MEHVGGLSEYREKRNFRKTDEPRGREPKTPSKSPIFVIQKHDARSLHYDFRLEADGVLKSWAVPKGPSLNPKDKRLARATEDHPLEYANFEGVIPEGEYGAGPVLVWDKGTYDNLTEKEGEPVPLAQALRAGHAIVNLHGEKLHGNFALTRFNTNRAKENWLLVKMKDRYAGGHRDPVRTKPASVISGRKIEQIGIKTRQDFQPPVEFSNTGKILFEDSGITKGDLLGYYRDIAPTLLPYLKDRPVMMQRFPDGIAKKGFYQKNIAEYFPDWIERVTVKKEDGQITHVLCNDPATLAYIVNQGCITPHVWLSRKDDLDAPDLLVFDLDPSSDSFEPVRSAAFTLRELLHEIELDPFVKTSGSRGVHVVVPLKRSKTFDEVREFARAVADVLVSREPELTTVEQRKAKREGKVFIDVARNAYAQTIAPAYAVRPLPDAPVSTPISWRELRDASLLPQTFNLRNVRDRLKHKDDPWKNMMKEAAALGEPMRRIAVLQSGFAAKK